jgi:hypothetical protein
MNRRFSRNIKLDFLLEPETKLESTLITVPEFRNGLLWGEPRYGHPEGMVAIHVREVLDNINQIPNLSPLLRNRLRLIALAHDAFKYKEDRSRPRDWSKHHGLLARRFMESYIQDPEVLDIIEFHDDAYYTWLCQHRSPSPNGQGLSALLGKVGYCLQPYYLFFKCDTQTGDKTQAPLRWFEQTAHDIEIIQIRPHWPWEKNGEQSIPGTNPM